MVYNTQRSSHTPPTNVTETAGDFLDSMKSAKNDQMYQRRVYGKAVDKISPKRPFSESSAASLPIPFKASPVAENLISIQPPKNEKRRNDQRKEIRPCMYREVYQAVLVFVRRVADMTISQKTFMKLYKTRSTRAQSVTRSKRLLQRTVVNRTYGKHKKKHIFTYFYQQYLVLYTMVPRNTSFDQTPRSHSLYFFCACTLYLVYIPVSLLGGFRGGNM